MNKQEYLNNNVVIEFIDWVGEKLDSNFQHNYNINNNAPRNGVPRNQNWINYNNNQRAWNCISIYDAYSKYFWNGANFNDTTRLLNELETSLRNSLETKNQTEANLACYNILLWGGQRVFRTNYPWINGLPNIIEYLNITKSSLNPIHFDDENIRNNNVVRFNAGLTKIYALCIDNFPMYDSRVAVALGILISQFLIAQNYTDSLPQELHFKIPPGGNNLTRPRIINGFKFGYTNNNIVNHQKSNVRASWLLEGILNNNPNSQFNLIQEDLRIRAIEAGLFMIGYSI